MTTRVALARDRHGYIVDRKSRRRTSGSAPATPSSNRSQPISGSSIPRSQNISRNDHPMDFGRTVVDSKCTRLAIEVFERRVGRDTEGAAELDGAIDDAVNCFG